MQYYNNQHDNWRFNMWSNRKTHDRYFILDNEIIYHRGASINRIGYKTFSITRISDNKVCNLLLKEVIKILERSD